MQCASIVKGLEKLEEEELRWDLKMDGRDGKDGKKEDEGRTT